MLQLKPHKAEGFQFLPDHKSEQDGGGGGEQDRVAKEHRWGGVIRKKKRKRLERMLCIQVRAEYQ